MAKKSKKYEDVTSFNTSDYSVKALSVIDSVDVAGVSGVTQFGSYADYTAYVTTNVTETTGDLYASLSGSVLPTGQSLSITTTFPVVLTPTSETSIAPIELISTITPATSGYTDSGTLSLVSGTSAVREFSVSVYVSGGYTLTDSDGVLSADGLPVSGTIVYSSGDWTVDFINQEILTDGTTLSADYQLAFPSEVITTPIVIRHVVGSNADYTSAATSMLSGFVQDVNGIAAYTSTVFTLSTDSIPDDNPWRGRGALPGETKAETMSRFMEEGII